MIPAPPPAPILTRTPYAHIILREDGVPIIEGTTTKVIEVVVEKLAYGWSPEEIRYQHPYLSLGQVYSALAYYADHTKTIDDEIEDDLHDYEAGHKEVKDSPFRVRLRQQGVLRS
jgi:uncharacterized protein (DUF433 family)